jgi:Putative beta barrel porin-7 (BBP7)
MFFVNCKTGGAAAGETVSMANSTRNIGLFLIAALWTSAAIGQDMPSSNWDDELPQEVSLPSADMPSGPTMGAETQPNQNMSVGAPINPTAPFEGYNDEFTPDFHGHFPAPIESTGTWLRRGFWYAETDAVVWNRLWNRDDKLFAADEISVEQPNFFDVGPKNVNRFTTNRLLYLESSHPGQDGSVRATLGHFFFRDSRNRDHTAEFTAFGGGDWNQERVIASRDNFGLFVPFYIDGTALTQNSYDPGPFDQSTRQTIDYTSDYSSFELNYRVKQRLGRDRMVMDPNGCWHRDANPGFEREFLVGLRFMEMGEQLDWRAEDIRVGNSNDLGNDGRYFITTENDLFGIQLGTGMTYQSKRWSLGVSGKGGTYINDASGSTALNLTVDDTNDYTNFFREDELSFIGEARLLGRFHLTPSFSLRAGYEFMFVESVALAPAQATFIPEFAFLNTAGDPFYHGASFGIEGYW